MACTDDTELAVELPSDPNRSPCRTSVHQLQAVNNTRAVCLKNKLKIGFNKLTIKSEQCCCNAYFMARFCVRAVKSTPAGTAVVGPTIPAKARGQVLVQASSSSVDTGPQVQGIEGPPTPPLASTAVAEANARLNASQKTVGSAATATQGPIAAPASSIQHCQRRPSK